MSVPGPHGPDDRTDKGKARRRFSVDLLERNTFTLSIAVVVIGLICLPNTEPGGSSWYVLMLVFGFNAILIIWILCRILSRNRKK